MREPIEIDVKQIIEKKYGILIEQDESLNKNYHKHLYAVCEPITPEITNWYYQVFLGREKKLETTSLRAAVEEYNKY